MPHAHALRVVCCLSLLGACATPRPAVPEGAETVSLLGAPLASTGLDPERRTELEADLAAAREAYTADPASEENLIWLGRRLAYLGKFREAVDVFTRGVALHPTSHRLLRHRGHRFITLRRFDDAVRDLERARRLAERVPDAVEPDGAPNAAGVLRSTDRSNIDYHLGLAYYLLGRFEEADRAFARRKNLAAWNDDMLVSTTHWRYLALRRVGRDREAGALLDAVTERMDVIENESYHRICLMYKGAVPIADLVPPPGEAIDPATGYAAAMKMVLDGDADAGRELLERIVREANWASFGAIAAEADLARTP